ncbi:preprotein translocase subunit YajC [Kitasatospora sp. MAP12-15]|uniref:preprotein translocase subunit YajC n=1 Tax=unclassified Kitasatospora TaxID=2633591 RepID=UPI002475B21D|nr:preprotein translocase subunit YajC [Kitasatospora sp. MAP12-44]MDH6114252.1 preprotein translocase subunit YajC [Kitasatospora sp. MAP12-44]
MQILIYILPVAAIFLMFRSQKKRQQQAASMQSAMQVGSAVRTIGGMYALVTSVNESSVELEIAPGVITHYAKSAIAAVIDEQEYDEIINGRPIEDELADLEDEVLENEAPAEESVSLDKGNGDTPAAK